MRVLPAFAAAGLVLLSATAHAEALDACPANGAILTLSDAVLTGREALPRLKARGIGAEAAYLKIRYGALPLNDAAALARSLSDAGVREAADLAGALDAMRGGFDAAPKDLQYGAMISTLRAILERGDAEKLLAALAALPPEQRIGASQRIVPVVVDWTDERKAALAAAAGRHDLFFLQAGLAATQRDQNAWSAFAAAFPQPTKLQDLAQAWNWAPALVGNPALPRFPLPDAAQAAQRRSLHTVWIAAAREPERGFLMTYLNQSGDIAATEKAAQAVLAEIDGGRIKPEGLLDAAWLKAYRALRAASANPETVETMLASIPFYGGRSHQSSGNVSVRDIIDRLLAVEALTPYLDGKAEALPGMPAELSARLRAEWPLWTEMADAVKTAPLAAFAKDEAKAPIIAELLLAAGDPARLADFILTVEPLEARLALATDFGARLDRGCGSVLHHQAEALTLSGQPIFKFPPAK